MTSPWKRNKSRQILGHCLPVLSHLLKYLIIRHKTYVVEGTKSRGLSYEEEPSAMSEGLGEVETIVLEVRNWSSKFKRSKSLFWISNNCWTCWKMKIPVVFCFSPLSLEILGILFSLGGSGVDDTLLKTGTAFDCSLNLRSQLIWQNSFRALRTTHV